MVTVTQEALNSVLLFLCKSSLLTITWLRSGPRFLVVTSGCVSPAGSAHDTELLSVLEGFCVLTKLGEAFPLLEQHATTMVMFTLSDPSIFSHSLEQMHSQL